MSLEEIAQEIEKEPEGLNASTQQLHTHATKELLETHRNIETETVNKKGEKSTKKERILEVDARTELPSPNAMAVLETVKDWFDEEFGKGTNKDLESFITNYKVDMISKERKSRQEAVAVLIGSALSNSQNQNVDLQKLVTQS